MVEEGPGIDVTGVGTAGSPYVVAADIQHNDTDCIAITGDGGATPLEASPIIDPASPVAITCGPAGLSIASVDGPISISEDGGVPVVAPGAVIDVLCGLESPAPGKLQVADSGVYAAMTAFDGTLFAAGCPSDLSGSQVYCDSAGELRAPPEHTAIRASNTSSTAGVGIVGAGTFTVDTGPLMSLTNTTCRTLAFLLIVETQLRFATSGGGATKSANHFQQVNTNGGGFVNQITSPSLATAAATNWGIGETITSAIGGTLAAGAVRTWQARVQITVTAGAYNLILGSTFMDMIAITR